MTRTTLEANTGALSEVAIVKQFENKMPTLMTLFGLRALTLLKDFQLTP